MPIGDIHARKRKAIVHPNIPSILEDQAIPSEGPSATEGILVLPILCYKLDVPRERIISCPFLLGVSLLMSMGVKWPSLLFLFQIDNFLKKGFLEGNMVYIQRLIMEVVFLFLFFFACFVCVFFLSI